MLIYLLLSKVQTHLAQVQVKMRLKVKRKSQTVRKKTVDNRKRESIDFLRVEFF